MAKKHTAETYERRSEILLDAYLSHDDEKTAAKHSITSRTLRNWKKLLDEDAEFSRIFRIKKEKAAEGWANEIPGAMRASVSFLKEAAETAPRDDPEVIRSVAGGLKILSSVAGTWKVLDIKLAKMNAPKKEKPALKVVSTK